MVGLNQRLRHGNTYKGFDEPALTDSLTNLHLQNSPYQPNQAQEPLQDDFTLLDVIGGAGISVLHPTKPIVAYTSGCVIIVFDLMSDTKI